MPERDFDEIAKLSERYNKDPESRIFVQLADAYRKNNMIDEALDVLNNGLRYHPQYALAYLIMGKCFFDKRMFSQAKESFEKTLALDPQNIVALRMLAQTCELVQDKEGQIAAYRAILNFDPYDASAKENFERLTASQKKEPLYTIAMAQEYETQQDLSKALEVYKHLLFGNPSDVSLQNKVNDLKQKLEEKKEIKEEKPEGIQLETAVETRDSQKEPERSVKAEEVQSLEDFLVAETKEKRVLEEPIPAPPPVSPPEEKIETAPPIQEAPVPKTEEPISEEPTPTAPEEPKPKEKEKEEEQKAREEDFKSFQDWLSGLLK